MYYAVYLKLPQCCMSSISHKTGRKKKGCNIFPSKFMNALMKKNQFSQTKVEHFRRLMTIRQMVRAGNQARLHEGEKGARLVN